MMMMMMAFPAEKSGAPENAKKRRKRYWAAANEANARCECQNAVHGTADRIQDAAYMAICHLISFLRM